MRGKPHIIAVGCVALLAPWLWAREDGMHFFEKEVRPILTAHCYKCHSEEAGKKKGGLWLDRREGWQIGGDLGAVITPGDPESSLMIHAIRYGDTTLQMPPKSKLPAEAVATLERWVTMGAPYSASRVPSTVGTAPAVAAAASKASVLAVTRLFPDMVCSSQGNDRLGRRLIGSIRRQS